MVDGPETSASPGRMLEMQNSGLTPDLLNQNLQFNKILVNLHAHSSLRSVVLDRLCQIHKALSFLHSASMAAINNQSQICFLLSSKSSQVMVPGSIGQSMRVGTGLNLPPTLVLTLRRALCLFYLHSHLLSSDEHITVA